MAIVDPDKFDTTGGMQFVSTAGRKIFAPVGHVLGHAKTGTRKITVGVVVLKDLDGSGDIGATLNQVFYLSEKAYFIFHNFLISIGCKEKFDDEEDTEIADVMANATPFVGDVFLEDGQDGKKYARIEKSSYRAYPDFDDSWDDVIVAASKSFTAYKAKQEIPF